MFLHPFSKEINKEYRRLASEFHTSNFISQINEQLVQENCLYGDSSKVAKFADQPLFFSDKVFSYLQSIVDQTDNLLRETHSALLRDSSILKFLGCDKKNMDFTWDLNPSRCFRIDGTILKGDKTEEGKKLKQRLKFMEINTNNPGGLYNISGIEKILLERDPVLARMSERYSFQSFDRVEAQANDMVNYFEEYQRRIGKNLGDHWVILGDSEESNIPYVQLQSKLEQKGLDVDIVNVGDEMLTRNNRGLYYKGKSVGFVHRRFEAEYLLKEANMIRDLSREKKLCVYNSFDAGALSKKKTFILFHDLKFRNNFLSRQSRDLIDEFIPRTYDFLEFDHDYLVKNKDDYVLKTNSGEGGKNVYVGKNCSQRNWKKVVAKTRSTSRKLKHGRHIVQEFMNSTKLDSERDYDYNMVSINGKFFPFGRLAGTSGAMTNIAQGASYIPCYRFSEK